MKANFNRNYAKEMLTIGGIGMTVGYYKIFCDITSRSILVNQLGIDQVGVYMPIIVWSDLFMGFIYPSIWQYLFPRICEAKDNLEITNVINDVLRFITFITIPFVFISISSRHLIIPLFYSKMFTAASIYLPLHFIGTFFLGWFNTLIQIFIPTGRAKQQIPFTIIVNTIYIGCIFFLTSRIGLWAWTFRYSIIPFFALLALVIFLKYEMGFFIKKENIYILLYGFIGAIFLWFFDFNFSISVRLFIAVILTILSVLFMKSKERVELKGYLIKILNKNKINRGYDSCS